MEKASQSRTGRPALGFETCCPNTPPNNAGRFEQETTEGTETDSILCFLRYLLLNLEATTFGADDADFFACVLAAFRLRFDCGDIASRLRVFVTICRRVLDR